VPSKFCEAAVRRGGGSTNYNTAEEGEGQKKIAEKKFSKGGRDQQVFGEFPLRGRNQERGQTETKLGMDW